MAEILIKNGYVIDPLNGIRGEVMDIGVKNGKIVPPDQVDTRYAKVIDASGCLVVPGGIDVHSHVAGPKVNSGRLLMPQDHYRIGRVIRAIPGVRRSGTGKSVPSVTNIGYKYARMGWTTVMEAASPPLYTRHTHHELDDTPIVDKGVNLLLDSNWFILEYIENKDQARVNAFISWILRATKSYAVKLVDPGSAEAWSRGVATQPLNIDDVIPGTSLTPKDILTALANAVRDLGLPHPIHVHANMLGLPGNYVTTMKTVETVANIANKRGLSIHLAHLQFNAYKGDTYATMLSAAEELAKLINNLSGVTFDMGQVVFGGTVTMTADAPWEFYLYHLVKWKWAAKDVEAETAAGIVPYKFRRHIYTNVIQWGIGLELALLVKDASKVVISTDHPNAGPFTRYPQIIAWLMSKKAREQEMTKLNKKAVKRLSLPAIDREYTFEEFVLSTRVAPAKIIGLEKIKGHLGVGADADIAIYNIDPRTFDPSREYGKLIKAIKYAKYTIKNGEIVVKDGKIVKTVYGRTFYVEPPSDPKLEPEVLGDVREKFKEWYSVALNNYVILNEELRKVEPIRTY